MTPHERFVLFVSVFAQNLGTTREMKALLVEEAYKLNPAEELWAEPMANAWEFVRYKMTGSGRPAWML